MAQSVSGGDVLLECLKAQGIRAVFGMPGNQNNALYDAFHRSGAGLVHYLVRHEQGATLLANGFARATGEAAAAFTVPGPGAGNAATGVIDAYTDCVPLVLVVGGYDRPFARRDRSKMFHGLDQEAFFKPIVRYFGRPSSANDIPRVVEEAFTALSAGRPGPVVIELAPDVAAETASKKVHVPPRITLAAHPDLQKAEILKAAARIRDMRRPAIFVGVDCVAAEACDDVRQLAEHLHAPVVYGRRGKGVLSDEHFLAAGFSRSKRVHDLLREADGLIAIGTRFTQIDTRDWTLPVPANVVQIDRDRGELGREFPITAGIAGNLRNAIQALLEQFSWLETEFDPQWPLRVHEFRGRWQAEPAIPVLSQIRQTLPRDALLAVDVTSAGYNCFDRYPVSGPRSLMYACHSVALGFAFPAAIGAKIAQPERPVVSLSGDAGFLMGCFELATAVQYNVGVVAVVVRDDCLTAIKGSQQQQFDGRSIDVDIRSPDFAALARSFGAQAFSTDQLDELPRLIQSGLAHPGPCVIELRLAGRTEELIGHIPWLHGE